VCIVLAKHTISVIVEVDLHSINPISTQDLRQLVEAVVLLQEVLVGIVAYGISPPLDGM
jgi:hypothetical protein